MKFLFGMRKYTFRTKYDAGVKILYFTIYIVLSELIGFEVKTKATTARWVAFYGGRTKKPHSKPTFKSKNSPPLWYC